MPYINKSRVWRNLLIPIVPMFALTAVAGMANAGAFVDDAVGD